jgi:hypothetical protein
VNQENERIATKYHELNPENVDEILAPNFKGEHWGGTYSWDRDSHRKYLASGGKVDKIHEQFGIDDRVCTRFTRSVTMNGKPVNIDGMHIKQFQNGKIVHVWEIINFKQIEEQTSDK